MAKIPSYISEDRYWKGVIHLFTHHVKLNSLFNTKYFDIKNGSIKTTLLKRESAPWSSSEKFMLNLALHLYNERHKVNLSDLDILDNYNKKIAMEAIKLRFF